MAILIDITAKHIKPFSHSDGRYIILDIEIDGTLFNVVNIYAPTKEKHIEQLALWGEITTELENFSYVNLIIGGDFNTVLNPKLDKEGGQKMRKNSAYTEEILGTIRGYNLTDIWRQNNPQTRHYTWSRRNPLIQCRLDFWLISEHLSSYASDVDIYPSIYSDHCLIHLTIIGELYKARGPGFWKLNTKLLFDKDYIDQIKLIIQESCSNYNYIQDKGLKWELIKCDIT